MTDTSKSTTSTKKTNTKVGQENTVKEEIRPVILVREEIIFQVTDWSTTSEDVETGDKTITKYVIRMFGLTKTGKKVFVKVTDFCPYFYVKIPETWEKTQVQILMDIIKKSVEIQDTNSDKNGVANSLKSKDIVQKCIFKEFTNYKTFKFIKLEFHSYEGFRSYQRAFNKKIMNKLLGPKETKYELFETNIDPMFRFMHNQNIKSMGMIKVGKYRRLLKNANISTDDIAISTNHSNVLPVDDNTILPLVIASFDLECMSADGSFPIPERDGDPIIQIGTTCNRYGEDECFYKCIITLDTCDPIEGAEVIQCATEKQLLLEWTKLIIRINPDVLTGYNIFGFDYPYLEGRAKKLGCYSAFSKLGRIKNVQCPYIEKDLSSAALGKNILHFFQMEGRVNIDVMKVIQRDHKLGSYKLDNVAADFIRDEIAYVQFDDGPLICKDNCNDERGVYEGETTKIYTKGIYGLDVGRVIKICFNDGLSDNSYRNDTKFKVLEICTKVMTVGKSTYDMIVIEGVLDKEALMLDTYTIFWGQAKDDVDAKTIFKMQLGSSKDRAVVAKYCIAEGTPIMLENSCVPIETLSNCNSYLLAWDENQKGLVRSKQAKFFDNGNKECIELTFEDGTKLTCTDDHKILTSNNTWLEAKDIEINKDRIVKSFTLPTSNIQSDIEKYSAWSFNGYNLTNEHEYNKTMAYMRILAYVLTDGCITKDRAIVFMGTKIDAINIGNDMKFLTGKEVNIIRAKNTYSINLPRPLSKGYLKIPGIILGNRATQASELPKFLLEENCPLPVIREFLGGLFGGDGNISVLGKSSKSNKFTNCGFSQTKSAKHIDSLKTMLSDIAKLLLKFNIKTRIHNPRNVKTSKDEAQYSICMNIEMDSIPLFEEHIGVRYCVNKSIRLAVTSSYYKLKQKICQQASWVINKTMEKGYKDYLKAVNEAHDLLKQLEPIYNERYSLPSNNVISRRVLSNKLIVTEIPIPSVDNYLRNVGAINYFMHDDHNKSGHIYAVKPDDTVIPTYHLKVIGKKTVGIKKVYDMEIETNHSYIANGIVVHNCLQDCVLVNKLINKLQIITNNCGMANVSSVPFSYIFLRGQGIKALSLVSKKCQERNHVMPVLRQPYVDKEKKKAEDALKSKAELKREKEEHALIYGYEGACVLSPKTGVYLDDPITVKDYNSLYPNSMRSNNLSQECKVVNDFYKNLPDYYYNEITYRNSDGTTKTCTFAKPKDPTRARGILVEILTELLNARADTRVLQKKEEKGSFRFNVLEGLQLAYKCTANSLYGQTGSAVSAIYDKDIAACTTAVGRAMLNCAKIFSEIIFNKLAELIHENNDEEYEKYMNLLFDKKIDEFIGEENIEALKNDPEEEKYTYLNVFKNNTMSVDDKLIDIKLGITCKKDYLNWFYFAMKNLLGTIKIAPFVVYGDSDSTFTAFKLRQNDSLIDGKQSA